jgi:molecular chaperone Hsp33
MVPRGEDLIRPFQIDGLGLRGRLVRLGPALDAIVERHGYPHAVAAMLGEATALAAVLAGALKYRGIFTLQTKGDGAIPLLVADVTSEGAVRAYAQYDAAALERALARGTALSPVPRLLGAGHLAFTVDQGEHTDRYQGIVELDGATLADCAHHYFRQSEQVGAGLRVAASRRDEAWRAGALMIQRLPAEGRAPSEAEEDGWRRALMLLGTARDDELTDPDLPPDALIYRLFHEEGVRVHPAQALDARCRCSKARIETILRSIPEAELQELEVEGRVEVTCEFCSTRYAFDREEVRALHGA